MLNKNVQYTVLCEDKQTQCFVRCFLRAHNIPRHKINFISLPVACGEQYVKTNYPKELKKLRIKNFNALALFVCIDADAHTVKERYYELKTECEKQSIDNRKDNESVALFVPKRNIETWIEWLKGKKHVNEDIVYSHNTGHESECKLQAEVLADMFIQNKNVNKALPSIQYAKSEYDHL